MLFYLLLDGVNFLDVVSRFIYQRDLSSQTLDNAGAVLSVFFMSRGGLRQLGCGPTVALRSLTRPNFPT